MTRAYAGRALGPVVTSPRLITKIRRVIGGVIMAVGIVPYTLENFWAPRWFDDMLDHRFWPVFVVGAIIFGPKTIYRTVSEYVEMLRGF